MKYKEARRLATEFDDWVNAKRTPEWCANTTRKTFVPEVDRRKAMKHTMMHHCYQHFDELLQALEILDNACDTGNALEIGKAQVKARSLVVKATNVKV